jgi:hypothetical protein
MATREGFAMVTATKGVITSASKSAGRGVAADKFNQGCQTFHREEIEVGKRLADAAVVVHGERESRRLLKSDPAAVFKSFRYGRVVDHDDGKGERWLIVLIDGKCADGKASNRHIMVPGQAGWAAVCERVRRLAVLPRWADGFSATAEALDEMGFAIAESIAAMLLLEIESDEDVTGCGKYFRRQASRQRSTVEYYCVDRGGAK